MYKARNKFLSISIVYWMVCMSATAYALSADLSGQWCLDFDARLSSYHNKWCLHTDDPSRTVCREEDVMNMPDYAPYDRPLGAGAYGWATQSQGRIEGHMTPLDPADRDREVKLTGTISDDNHVRLTFSIAGMARSLGNGWHVSATEILGSFEGVYDPVDKSITGTFRYNQERIYFELDLWNMAGHEAGTDEYTRIDVSGAFMIAIYTPVILVPGWAHVPDVWKDFAQFLQEDFANRPWVTEFYRDFRNVDGWFKSPFEEVWLPQCAYPETNAEILAMEIEIIREKNDWRGKIDLIAHSQGGLDARAYLRNLGDKAKDQIKSLTTIATPNHGTDGATKRDALITWTKPISSLILGKKPTPWLTPRWVEAFDQNTPLTDGVKYYTIAGDIRMLGISNPLVSGYDDGVVPVESVLIRDERVTHLGTFPYGHNELVTRREVYDVIKNKIDPPYSEEPNSLAFIEIEDAEVLPSHSVTKSIVIDDLNEVSFVLISYMPLDFTLQSPNGEFLTPQSNAGVAYDSGSWLDLQTQSYIVRSLVPGMWNAYVTGGTDLDHFMLLVTSENTFVLDGVTDKYFIQPGENVQIKARLKADAAIRKMQAEITGPDGLREIVLFYDDGIHRDDSPNDGLYGNSFTPSLEGEYIILFSAEGDIGGKEFSRADLESIFVVASGADSF